MTSIRCLAEHLLDLHLAEGNVGLLRRTHQVMAHSAFSLNADGTARDPRAFQNALRSDQETMTVLQSDPEVLNVILGEDVPAMQSMLRAAFQVRTRIRKAHR